MDLYSQKMSTLDNFIRKAEEMIESQKAERKMREFIKQEADDTHERKDVNEVRTGVLTKALGLDTE